MKATGIYWMAVGWKTIWAKVVFWKKIASNGRGGQRARKAGCWW